MDFEQAKQDIINWIEQFVSKSNPNLNGWPPCPYARKALLDGTVDIREGTTPMKDFAGLSGEGMGKMEVVIFVYNPTLWPKEKFFVSWVDASNIFLDPQGLFALDDHPDEEEVMNNVNFSQGKYAMLLVQERQKLEDASDALAKKGYYNNWDPGYLKQLFYNRKNPL